MEDSDVEEFNAIKEKYGFDEPDRGNLDDSNIKWRTVKPVYTKANLAYMKGKSKNHDDGSLEKVVENLVKTWEMEASHKVDFSQWTTIDHEKYQVSANGGKMFFGEDAKNLGNYNTLLDGVKKEIYDSSTQTFESSHELFRNTFKNGFPWEVLNVFSGPPKVVFSWRHWGLFNGEYREQKGDGNTYEMFGICEVAVTDDLKIQSIEVYYKPDEFLQSLDGLINFEDLKGGKTIMGDGCPIVHAEERGDKGLCPKFKDLPKFGSLRT